MKILTLKIHGVLDYVTVLAFLVIPTVFGLSGTPAYLSYALAAVHLLMTLLTKFPLGVLRVVPVTLHKIVEAIVGPVLIVIPWILRFSTDLTARNVFIGAGVVILLVGALTNYVEGQTMVAPTKAAQ